MAVGQETLDKMQELGNIVLSTVAKMAPLDWLRIQTKNTPPY